MIKSLFISKKQMNIFDLTKVKSTKTILISILIYFIILAIIDGSKILNIYGENVIRRIIHMFRRRDPLSYKKFLQPFCKKVPEIINAKEVHALQSIKINENKDIPWFSRSNTTTHYNFSTEEMQIIKDVEKQVNEKYEQVIGKKLYIIKSHAQNIYIYHGHKSKHLWHVDPNNRKEIYNAIVCFKRIGNISPFQYKDEHGVIHSHDLQEGDAVLFNGGTTVHQIPENTDPNSKRYVLSLAFTSDVDLINPDVSNLCTFIEGGKNYLAFASIIIMLFLLNFILSQLANTKIIPYKVIVIMLIISILVCKYLPFLNLGIGTSRSSSISFNIILLSLFLIATLSIKGGSLLFMYFILSDVFFPRSWVFYY